MYPKDNRLAKTRDFNLLLKYGRWANGRIFDLKYLNLPTARKFFPPKEESDNFEKQLKLAITVGLKISKKAVDRNRIKRQASEAIRLLLQKEEIASGYYFLFVAKKGALDSDYTEISQEVKLLLRSARAIL